MCVRYVVSAYVILLGPCLSCMDVSEAKCWLDTKSWILKPSFWYESTQSLHQNGRYHIHPKTIQGKGKSSLFKLEDCCTALFHFPVRWIVHLNRVEHNDQNCVSLCILICSPRILLYFHWSKMGYGAWGYSFSLQPFFLRPIKIWNPPTPQWLKEWSTVCQPLLVACFISLGGVAGTWHSAHRHTLHCQGSHWDISNYLYGDVAAQT